MDRDERNRARAASRSLPGGHIIRACLDKIERLDDSDDDSAGNKALRRTLIDACRENLMRQGACAAVDQTEDFHHFLNAARAKGEAPHG